MLSTSRWVALRVFTLLKADALLFFFLMDSISILKNLKREDSYAHAFGTSTPTLPSLQGQDVLSKDLISNSADVRM